MKYLPPAIVLAVSLLLGTGEAHAFDLGEAMVSCQKSPQFKAGNSAKQCVVLPKNAEGRCRVAVAAIGGGYIESSFIAYDCDKKCDTRPEETSWKGDKSGIGAVCHNGCKYTDSLYAGSPTGHLYTPPATRAAPTSWRRLRLRTPAREG